MNHAAQVLLAVATELSDLAKNSLPALCEGETVKCEWFENATLYRETNLNGQKFIAQFNFLQRRAHRTLMKGGNTNG